MVTIRGLTDGPHFSSYADIAGYLRDVKWEFIKPFLKEISATYTVWGCLIVDDQHMEVYYNDGLRTQPLTVQRITTPIPELIVLSEPIVAKIVDQMFTDEYGENPSKTFTVSYLEMDTPDIAAIGRGDYPPTVAWWDEFQCTLRKFKNFDVFL